MSSMKNRLAMLGVLLLLTGCAMIRSQSPIEAELQNVANCFFDATSLLQGEPEEKGSLSAFLREAKVKQKTKGTGNFSALLWDETGADLRLAQGQTVLYRLADRSHDDFDNGASANFTTYEFFTEQSDTKASITVSVWFGSPMIQE